MSMAERLPGTIENVDALDELLSRPSAAAIETMGRIEGDLLFLGVGGKMGPTMARMAVRASQAAGKPRRVIGVSRFSQADLKQRLEGWGIEAIAADLLDEAQLAALPDAANVVAMPAMKFGATGQASLTWAMNVWLAGAIGRRYAGSRIVAFSTGNVYPLTPVRLGGCRESDPLGPVGEYAMSALGRERMYEHFSRTQGTLTSLVRLNYACELRYGVLADIAMQVAAGTPVDLTVGHVNAIWQGDANAMALSCFDLAASPPVALNVAGPETLSVRQVAQQFGDLLGREVAFTSQEADEALLSNGQQGHRLFGYPRVGIEQMIRWIADWVKRGGQSLGKPTKFQVRDGKF